MWKCGWNTTCAPCRAGHRTVSGYRQPSWQIDTPNVSGPDWKTRRPEPGSYRPRHFADPANSFHEKAALCRAAENTCFFATVNFASDGSPTTSAVVRPDGTLLCYQPYGEAGLLIADIDLVEATGILASRCKPL